MYYEEWIDSDYETSTSRTNGFVERFNRTVLDEFFRTAFRDKFYETVAALQEDLDAWLHHYNHERPHRGYRNMGKRPIETITQYLQRWNPRLRRSSREKPDRIHNSQRWI